MRKIVCVCASIFAVLVLPLYAKAGMKAGVSSVCPDCGNSVVIGRHGHEPGSTVCPYCGEEVCPAEGEEKDYGAGVDLGFFSKYVSRGVTLSDDPVFQPNVWVSYSCFTFGVWGNMDMTDINMNSGEFNELDFTIDYTGRAGVVEYSAGGIYYVFPNSGGDDTAEVYAAAGLDVPLQPSVTLYYDFVEADGLYGAFGIGHTFDLPLPSDEVSAGLELSAQLGWGTKGFNEFNAGTYHTSLTDLSVTACLPVDITGNISVHPTVTYSTVLTSALRANNEGNHKFVFGVVASGSI